MRKKEGNFGVDNERDADIFIDGNADNSVPKDEAANDILKSFDGNAEKGNAVSDEMLDEKVEGRGSLEDAEPHISSDSAAILKGGGKKKSGNVMNISARAFIMVMIILGVMIIAAGILTYIIPQGSYARDDAGEIIAGSFTLGARGGYPVWRWLTAPFEVFASSDAVNIIMVSLFLVILSGTFNVMGHTDGIKVLVNSLVRKFKNNRGILICLVSLVFMAFGSFFGMFEELVALMPIIIALSLSMGYDTLTGMGMCMLAACFGFSAAIVNPFSVGTAFKIVGLSVTSGMWLRLIFFVVIFALVSGFLLLHTKRISADPKRSLTYKLDLAKRAEQTYSSEVIHNEKKIFRSWIIFFAVLVAEIILIASVKAISGLSVPILAISFLFGGFICGAVITRNFKKVGKWFLSGILSMLPAVIMIACAASVKFIMDKGGIIDTIMYNIISYLDGKSPYVAILLIFALVLFFQIFIGSATAKAMLIIPIIAPICLSLGISYNLAILAFVLADGFTNVLFPTNPVLLVGLSMAEVNYGKWFKFTILIQIIALIISLGFLCLGVAIGY